MLVSLFLPSSCNCSAPSRASSRRIADCAIRRFGREARAPVSITNLRDSALHEGDSSNLLRRALVAALERRARGRRGTLQDAQRNRSKIAQRGETGRFDEGRQYRGKRADASAMTQKSVGKIEPRPPKPTPVATSNRAGGVGELALERQQRFDGELLRAQGVPACGAVWMDQVDAHRLTDHADTPAARTQPNQEIDVLAHLAAGGISPEFDEGAARDAQCVCVTEVILDEGGHLRRLHHNLASALRLREQCIPRGSEVHGPT